jgi:hypothetical protein
MHNWLRSVPTHAGVEVCPTAENRRINLDIRRQRTSRRLAATSTHSKRPNFHRLRKPRANSEPVRPSLNLHNAARPASGFLQVLLIESDSARPSPRTPGSPAESLPIKANDFSFLISLNIAATIRLVPRLAAPDHTPTTYEEMGAASFGSLNRGRQSGKTTPIEREYPER